MSANSERFICRDYSNEVYRVLLWLDHVYLLVHYVYLKFSRENLNWPKHFHVNLTESNRFNVIWIKLYTDIESKLFISFK
jgi:hypothetical protein